MENKYPGVGGEPFTIRLSSQWFNPGDMLIPQYTFWQKFFRCITFGLYKPKTFAYKAANFDPNAPSWTTVRKDDVPYIINIITNGENKEGKV